MRKAGEEKRPGWKKGHMQRLEQDRGVVCGFTGMLPDTSNIRPKSILNSGEICDIIYKKNKYGK